MQNDVQFTVEKQPVVCFPRILAENLKEINSTALHFWMYCLYSKDIKPRDFKSKFGLNDGQFTKTLVELEMHNLIEFNEESRTWKAKNGLDFVY